MLKIGICDMDAQFIQKLQMMLNDILDQYADWEARVYLDSAEVIAEIEEGNFTCNLLFLDIFQKNETGLAIAQMVNEKHIDTDIIFITAAQNYVFECYKYHAFAYLLKPLKASDIALEVERYLKEVQLNPKCLNILNRGIVTKIPLDTILYIESNHRKIVVHTQKCDYEYYEKLDNLEKLLKKDGFVRSHQSYLVACDKITAYKDQTLQVGPYAVPVSRRYKEGILECLEELEVAVSKTPVSRSGADSVSIALGKDSLEMPYESFLTSGLFQYNDIQGALVCVKGAYLGKIVRFVPEQTILVGRDDKQADMVINLPMVSRQHCTIVYHAESNDYEVVDRSSNGTFVDGTHRLVRGDTYRLKPGATISFGDNNTIYRLG